MRYMEWKTYEERLYCEILRTLTFFKEYVQYTFVIVVCLFVFCAQNKALF